jgi:hypothetical protein
LLNRISNESFEDFRNGRIRRFVPERVQEGRRSSLSALGNEALVADRVQERRCSLLIAFRNEGVRC